MSLPCRNSSSPDQMGCRLRARPSLRRATAWLTDPFALFDDWFAEARASEPNDPEAMALATADARRPAVGAHGAAQGPWPGRLRLLHQRAERARASSSPPIRARRCCSTGSRCAGRSASKARSSASPDAEADAYFATPRARFAARRLGFGPVAPARQPRDLRAALRRDRSGASKARTCRARRIGAAIASCPSGSNSGPTGRTGCTSGACSPATDGGWTEGLLYP